ncbi:WD40-repeat-containing domain protein, partial [Pyronema omphalodes]
KNKKCRKASPQEIFLQRETGAYTSRGQTKAYYQSVAKSYLPESNADFVIENERHSYIGQFSDDGNFFYSASQDMRIQLYDTQDPLNWKHYKSVLYSGGQWTISDASLSPDNRLLAYASLTSAVFVADTTPESSETRRIEFANRSAHSMRHISGIMSVRFSGDGSELLVGAKDACCYLYDLNAGRAVLRLQGHDDEVNAVCYGDKNSPHIIYSGSDDATIKIWDRRSISDGRPLGVFTGHLEGVTFVHSKGDGRYVLSNGKDQRMKLWDLRMMMDTAEFDNLDPGIKYPPATFDYRNERFRERGYSHRYDKSLVSYRGHKVYRTLIRCYFSPLQSTGSRYVYTGSADGVVRIFNIDSTLASTIDVNSATEAVRKANEGHGDAHSWYHGHNHKDCCIRDVSWHPSAPVVAATGFQGNHIGVGSISVHSWKGA